MFVDEELDELDDDDAVGFYTPAPPPAPARVLKGEARDDRVLISSALFLLFDELEDDFLKLDNLNNENAARV